MCSCLRSSHVRAIFLMFNNKTSYIYRSKTICCICKPKIIGSYWKFDYEGLYKVSLNFKQSLQNHTTITLKQLKGIVGGWGWWRIKWYWAWIIIMNKGFVCATIWVWNNNLTLWQNWFFFLHWVHIGHITG
jgi:hypothetical protein